MATTALLRHEPIKTPPHRPQRPFRRHGDPFRKQRVLADAVTRGRCAFVLAAAFVSARGEGVEVKGGWVWEREGEGEGDKRKGTYRKGKGPHIHVTVAAEGK